MVVLVDRVLEAGRVAGEYARRASGVASDAAERPLHDLPAVVLPARARTRLKIDLLPRALSYIEDVEIPRQPVEGEPPGVAQPLGPDLIERQARTRKRVGRRDPVKRGGVDVLVDVDAQNLAQ